MRMQAWPTLAAWGAGLIQLATGAGMLTAGPGGAARPYGVVLTLTGAAALAWGVVWLSRARHPRIGIGIAVAGLLLTTGALAVDTAHVSVLAVTVAAALSAVAGASTAVILRRRERQEPLPAPAAPRASAPGAGMGGLLAAAVVVAALVTPALASTEAGRLAPDHGAHTFVIDHGHGH